MIIFDDLLNEKKLVNGVMCEDLKDLVKNPEVFLERMKRFGLLEKKIDNKYYATFNLR